MKRDTDLEATIVAKFVVMGPLLDERGRRLWAAAESMALGYGGDAVVSSAWRRACPCWDAFVDRALGGRGSSRSSQA